MSNEHSTIRQQVLSKIQSDIISGTYKSGEKLYEKNLAERYHVSRTPLREAIRQLQMEGWLDEIPNKGVRVASITQQDVHDNFQIRRLLEGYATGIAAKHMPLEEVRRLRGVLSLLRSNTTRGEHEGNNTLIREIHTSFLKYSENKQLQQVIYQALHRFARLRYLLTHAKNIHQMYDCIDRILDALEKHDEKQAQACMVESLDIYEKLIFEDILIRYPDLITR